VIYFILITMTLFYKQKITFDLQRAQTNCQKK
jgi:hypothetical protein